MTQNLIAVMFSLLRYEIGQGDALGEEERAFCSEQMELLYKLSKKHDIAHLIGDALSKQKLLESGDEWAQKFQKERLLALYRYEQLNFALGEICQTLEEAKIPFMPLKGSVIRPYYPEPWMRTSCDIDVLVHEEDLDRAVAALTEGSTNETGVSNAFTLETPPRGYVRFRREASNLGREAYKGTSSPKFDGKKSPYQMENFEEKPIPVSFSNLPESGTFFFSQGLFWSRQM